MKRNNDKLTGTSKVFAFTLRQFIKNKGNLISFFLLFFLSLISVPVATLVGGGGAAQQTASQIETVYVQNDTSVSFTAADVQNADDGYFAAVAFENGGSEGALTSYDVFCRIAERADGVQVTLSPGVETALGDTDLLRLQTLLETSFEQARCRAMGITDAQLALSSAPCEITTATVSEYLHPGNGVSEDAQYILQFVYSVFMMMVSIMTVSYIIRAVIEEKVSKLVELLMVSVSPLALIVGKILAAMVYVLGIFLATVLGFALSYFVSARFLDVSALSSMLPSLSALRLGFSTILIILVSLVLGYLTFSLIAGLSGAGCSKNEDVQGATSGVTLLVMACYMGGIFVGIFANPTISVVVSLLPFLSVFCAPVQYVLGNIALPVLLLSWVIQAAIVVFLSLLCASVYRNLLLHSGNRVKFTQLLRFAGKKEAV